MSKYEITDIQHHEFPELRRIRALRDIPKYYVTAGDPGGWVESEENLSQSGSAWIHTSAQVSGDACVYGDALVFGRARVSGHALVYGNAEVYGNAVVSGVARVSGDSLVSGNARVLHPSHVLTAYVYASREFLATLCRDVAGHTLTVGCWEGTVPEFRAMIESDKWVEAGRAARALRRPELLAFAAMCEARVKSWEDNPVLNMQRKGVHNVR